MIAFNIQMLPIMGVLFISSVSAFEKQWLKTNSWTDPLNWDPPRLPCPNDNIVLKEAIVYIEKNVTIQKELNLPPDVEIIFGPNTNLFFEDISERKRRSVSTCSGSGGTEVSFVGQGKKKWLNPMNWDIYTKGEKDEYMTKAVPYIERVPCINDRVSFPKGNAFEIDIKDGITIKDMILNGQVITDDAELQSYLATKEGKSRFNFVNGASLKLNANNTCGSSGCKCGNDVWKKKICNTFKCPRTCAKKVKPNNDCCYHCGALVNIKYDHKFHQNECLKELRSFLHDYATLKKGNFAGVRLYMFPIGSTNNEVQILVSEDSDGSNAEAAADSIKKYLKTSTSKVCGGTKSIKVGKVVKEKEDTSGKKTRIALSIVLPIVFVALLIIAVAYFQKKRTPEVKRQRFDNEEEFGQYPGVHDIEMTTEFTNGPNDLYPGAMAFENPSYKDLSEKEACDEETKDEVASPEYAIPIVYTPKRSIPETNETPRYVEGLSNAMYNGEKKIDPEDIEGDGGNTNPLYAEVMKDYPDKETPVASEVDLDSTDELDSIKSKLQLTLKEPSDSEEDSKEDENEVPVEEIGEDEPRYI